MIKLSHITAAILLAAAATACNAANTSSPASPHTQASESMRITGELATARRHAGDVSYRVAIKINGELVAGGKLAEDASRVFVGSYRQQPVRARCVVLPQEHSDAVVRCDLSIGSSRQQTLTFQDFAKVVAARIDQKSVDYAVDNLRIATRLASSPNP